MRRTHCAASELTPACSARRGRLSHALAGTLISSALVALAGSVLIALCPGPAEDWGFWFGIGIVTYAVALLVHGSLFHWRLFANAKRPSEE